MDLGGTKILAGLVARDGTIGRTIEIPTPDGTQEAVLGAIDGVVADLLGDGAAAIGYGVPLEHRPPHRASLSARSTCPCTRCTSRTGRVNGSACLPASRTTATPPLSRSGASGPVAMRPTWSCSRSARASAAGSCSTATSIAAGPSSATSSSSPGGSPARETATDAGTSRRTPPALLPTGRPRGSTVQAPTRRCWSSGRGPATVRRLPRSRSSGRCSELRSGRSSTSSTRTSSSSAAASARRPETSCWSPPAIAARAEAIQPADTTLRIVEAELGEEAGLIGAGLVAFEALDGVR